MKRTYSPAQTAYLTARATYDTTIAALYAELGECPDDDSAVDAYVDQEIELRAQYGMRAIEDALRAAETNLIAWGKANVQTVAGYAAHRDELEKLYANTSPIVRTRLVDLTMKLAA